MSFFRSFANALKADRLAQQARLLWLSDVTAVADHYAYLTKPDIPDLLFDRGFKSLRNEDIEGVAQSARDHFGLGMKPIDNMVAFLEDIGVIVGSEPIETDRLDAVSRAGGAQTDGHMSCWLMISSHSHVGNLIVPMSWRI